ncbi:polysaccharide biosynthesis/export family protein [Desulfobacula toluolica]|uniref:Periplasmic polysaccharide export protein n=1 Tax=Desulfobacula toluolica (strain DSM 7467 / Tol2) TaxID=651182 RepID=K0NHT8_DESTT|nr:polysaccharide biosynthesis/export family protein [Desulfobacula toluolica]CCK80495.1 periplasmic polysaccharide export protein [Desulfobacula toluolica Tol2]
MFKIKITSIVSISFIILFCSVSLGFDEDYKIGIGDVLKIDTWKEPDLSRDAVQVRSDGKITFPLLDDLQAEGVTTVELKKIIEKKLADFVEAPSVTITLVGAVSQKYYILGEVQNVGEYPLIKKLTIVQAFALAKGFTEWASKDEIILYRKQGNTEKIIKIDYDDIVKGKLGKDMVLKADDIIIVP